MFITKLGIDLGTCNSLVFIPGKGVTLQEPSVVAVSLAENTILAVGEEAKEMIGRTPDAIRVYRPLRDGVIPAGITSTERRAVVEAAIHAGAKAAYIAKEPILAAIGAGIPINSSSGHMIINIGGGTSEVAVISLGGIVVASSLRVAGDKFDQGISSYIKKVYNLAIGEKTAEEVKIKIGTALPEKQEHWVEIRGRDLMHGLPKTLRISSNEVVEAIQDPLQEIVQAVKFLLRETPAELSADIMDKGMIVSGGGALLRNIDQLLSQAIGVPCFIAEDPLRCVARGTGVVLDNLEVYKRSVMAKK
ncbi:MAG: rod shape-determining protein [Candidatus Wildermuthbacteria bacterium]|nr:rod shape-determining protein [Candidatus Wildermuthbacteria bacterium]